MPDESIDIVRLVRDIVKSSIDEAIHRPRVTRTLAGNVEDLDSDLDVVFVRMDGETMGTDPRESDNYESPGIIPTSRLGETFVDEAVRVMFEGAAGGSAMRTGVEGQIVLPFGTEVGQRIVIDSTGGVRFWDENDQIRLLMSSSEGLQVRDPESGITGVVVRKDGIIVADPTTGETISIASGLASSVPPPRWASSKSDTSPGTTHSTPAISSFGTADDLDLRFVSASVNANIASASYTPPGSYTEQSDSHNPGSLVTLATSLASRDPAIASPGVANFTNTSSAFSRRVGHSVVVRGGGTSSPAVGTVETNDPLSFQVKEISLTIEGPASPNDGDLILAHVALAGSAIPIAWSVPEGWIQVGVQAAGIGTNHVLGSGIWYKRWHTGDPTTEVVTITMTAAVPTLVQATIMSVTDPFGFSSGLDVRLGDSSMGRGLVRNGLFRATASDAVTAPGGTTDMTITCDVVVGRRYELKFHSRYNTGANNVIMVARRTGVGIGEFAQGAGVVGAVADGHIIFEETTGGTFTFTVGNSTLSTSNMQLLASSGGPRTLALYDVGSSI